MIIKNYQLESNNIKKYNFFLFYGDNEGLKDEKINDVHKSNNYKKILYYEKEILNDVENFSNTVTTKSFFDNEKIIIVKNATDKILDLTKDIVSRKIDGIIIIFNAEVLNKKSKLRNFFEKNSTAVCVPCYLDSSRDLEIILIKEFKRFKVGEGI